MRLTPRLTAVIVLTTAAIAVVIAISTWNHKVDLGPMPSESHVPDPLARDTAAEMRDWIENLGRADARELNTKGRVRFSWEKMNAFYPAQARTIDDYVEQRRIEFTAAFEARSNVVPDRLVMHREPDSVTVESLGNGKYRVVAASSKGISHSALEISTSR
jgi:hypothetical protein